MWDGSIMKTDNPEVKAELLRRLRRIEGQVRGVQKMIDEERDCQEILQQLIAIRSAVQGASLTYLQQVARDCLLNPDTTTQDERSANLTELITLLGKVS
jgi:CsoR family transcriptional regulator, copper-sensing transcriptional repressor